MASFRSVVEENRHAFVAYTISRIRELLRNLPPERSDLFQGIPFLLHVNGPEFPGFVAEETAFYGIYRFEQSGFFRHALKTHGKSKSQVQLYFSPRPMILGLYLMGSAGTLTQTRNSDFDYWVIVREEDLGFLGRQLLDRKLRGIEAWCREKHGQDVTFFIMDIVKLRNNEFQTVDGESSGSAQRTLLKDEFYRTFIMIAGKIPLWAVWPSGMEYPVSGDRAMEMLGDDADDYIDTGDLSGIDPRECLGAILWQVYKARNDPVKALIKASLHAAYAFSAGDPDSLISSKVKATFSKASIDDFLYDPYVMVFDTVMAFYRDMDDIKGLHLIRQCIILRLLSYPMIERPSETSPKGRLLKRFVNTWDQGQKSLNHLKKAMAWSEDEKIAFEHMVFDKLSFLYELILRGGDYDGPAITMSRKDLDILKHRTAAFIQKKKGKLPRCSTYLRRKASKLELEIRKTGEKGLWAVCVAGERDPVFQGDNHLMILGWLFANDLQKARFVSLPLCYNEILQFMAGFYPRPDDVFTREPEPERMIVHVTKDIEEPGETHAFYLLFNSWGEVYFGGIALSAIESAQQKCYKISNFIADIQTKNTHSTFQHLICHPDEDRLISLKNRIEHCLETINRKHIERHPQKDRELPDEGKTPMKKNKPFLDLL